jgi:hypothetical protein
MGTHPTPPTWLDAYFKGGYSTIQSGATLFPQELILDFEGAGVSIADDAVNGKTVVTISAGGAGVGHTTASFAQPAVGANVTVPVDTTAMLTAGVTVYIAGGGWYTVASVTDGTHFVATNLGLLGNASPAATVTSPALVVPSGPSTVGFTGEIRFSLGLTTTSSLTLLALPAQAYECDLIIKTAYSPGTTIQIGQAGSPSVFQTVANNDPQQARAFPVIQDTAAVAGAVLATVGGSPSVGSSIVVVRFSSVPSP